MDKKKMDVGDKVMIGMGIAAIACFIVTTYCCLAQADMAKETIRLSDSIAEFWLKAGASIEVAEKTA